VECTELEAVLVVPARCAASGDFSHSRKERGFLCVYLPWSLLKSGCRALEGGWDQFRVLGGTLSIEPSLDINLALLTTVTAFGRPRFGKGTLSAETLLVGERVRYLLSLISPDLDGLGIRRTLIKEPRG
jgi:hypothetical protein